MNASVFKYLWWDVKKHQFWFDLFRKILDFVPGTGGDLARGAYWALFLRSSGDNLQVRPGVNLSHPENLVVGNNVRINVNCYIDAGGGISIGNNVLLGPDAKVWSVSHCFSDKSIPVFQQGYFYGPVEISDNVWIGANSIILPNVKISEGVIIGASSLITACQILPSYSVYGGVPGKIIKNR